MVVGQLRLPLRSIGADEDLGVIRTGLTHVTGKNRVLVRLTAGGLGLD
jgi:hypothetical protein